MKNILHQNNGFIGKLSFFAFCLSTVFMVFFSTSAIQVWPSPWNRVSILLACMIPVFLVFMGKAREWLDWKEFKKHLLLATIIVVLGILNMVFSEDRAVTIKVMSLFLISGIGVFAISRSVLMDRPIQDLFLWIGWTCFLILCAYGVFEYLTKKSILLLSNNPIPAGSLLILLSAAPLVMLGSRHRWVRISAVLTLLIGIVMLFMIGKRGSMLALFAMVLFSGFALPWKKTLSLILLALLLSMGGYVMRDRLNPQLTKHYFKDINSLLRAENYFFAGTIWVKKPIVGIGLHAPLAPYLENYEPKIYRSKTNYAYDQYIINAKTLENIVLCGFVEMGTLFSLTYIVLIAIILKKMITNVRQHPEKRTRAILLLMPLFGFFVHSMTFDSIIYPHLNWLAHVQLGMAYNFGLDDGSA
jgi:hypothetical protein